MDSEVVSPVPFADRKFNNPRDVAIHELQVEFTKTWGSAAADAALIGREAGLTVVGMVQSSREFVPVAVSLLSLFEHMLYLVAVAAGKDGNKFLEALVGHSARLDEIEARDLLESGQGDEKPSSQPGN